MDHSTKNTLKQGLNTQVQPQQAPDRRVPFAYQINKLILFSVIYIFMNPTPTLAHQINIDITGLSYHIGANSNNPADISAPRRLDKNAAFVFNPGISLGWDFRSVKRENGFSGIIKAIYFRDCEDQGFGMLGGGARYRCFFSKSFSGDMNAMAMLSAGKVQYKHTSTYNYAILPLILLGLNYHFKNDMILGSNFTLVPRNSSFNATGDFWILFGTLQLSFPILS